MSTKHTSAPWTVGDSGLSILRMTQPDSDHLPQAQRIADIYEPCQFDPEARANAALIAAAPDLLTACLDALDRLNCANRRAEARGEIGFMTSDLIEVIRKAKGAQ